METPNIQLYNLFRQDLHLTDGKSLELMHLLDKEYKGGVKEDITALGRSLDTRFDKIDTRFQTIEDCLSTHDKRFDALDNKMDKNYAALDSKIDIKTAELRTEIHRSRASIIIWVIGFVLTIFALALGFLKK